MKHFLVILAITAIVWLGVSMSDKHEYPISAQVHMTGVDTVRYAVLYADSVLPLQVEMSGFNAALVSLFDISPEVDIDMSQGGDSRAVAISDCTDNIRQQLSGLGVARVVGNRDSIRLRISRRASRKVPVRLDSLSFTFADQYGLYGEPRVEPAVVTLYGDDSVLSTIDAVQFKTTSIDGINQSGKYTLALDQAWCRRGDIRASDIEATVYLPVEPYVEREYSVPIEVDSPDSNIRLRLYPEAVKVRVWIAQRDIVRSPDFRVTVDYSDILSGATHVSPRLVQFPSWLRPRSIEPSQVQCVLMKSQNRRSATDSGANPAVAK